MLPFRLHRQAPYKTRRDALVMLAEVATVIIKGRREVPDLPSFRTKKVDHLVMHTMHKILSLGGMDVRMRGEFRRDYGLIKCMAELEKRVSQGWDLPGMRGVMNLWKILMVPEDEKSVGAKSDVAKI